MPRKHLSKDQLLNKTPRHPVVEALINANCNEQLEFSETLGNLMKEEAERIFKEEVERRNAKHLRALMELFKTLPAGEGYQSSKENDTQFYDVKACTELVQKGLDPVPCGERKLVLRCTKPGCGKSQCDLDENQKLKRCIRCFSSYCSKECQTAHWPEHKSFCNSRKAFFSRFRYWRSHLPEHLSLPLYDVALQQEYIAQLETWLQSADVIELTERTNVDPQEILKRELKRFGRDIQ